MGLKVLDKGTEGGRVYVRNGSVSLALQKGLEGYA